MKNTTFQLDLVAKLNTKEIREELIELGYDIAVHQNSEEFHNLNPYVFTNGMTASAAVGFLLKDDELFTFSGGAFFCKDKDLFLALAALSNDTDYKQWFIKYDLENGILERFMCLKDNVKDFRPDATEFHKETVSEIMDQFTLNIRQHLVDLHNKKRLIVSQQPASRHL